MEKIGVIVTIPYDNAVNKSTQNQIFVHSG